MIHWNIHRGGEFPDAVPLGTMVRTEDDRVGPVYKIQWDTGLRWRVLQDARGRPYCTDTGLPGWVDYVATDVRGRVHAFSAAPIGELAGGQWAMAEGTTHRVVAEQGASVLYEHPGPWTESLLRVWRG